MVGLHLYEISKIVKFLKTESTVVVTRGWGSMEWEMRCCCLMGREFQFCKMKRVLEINCTTTSMYSTLLKHYAFKDGKFCFLCDYS